MRNQTGKRMWFASQKRYIIWAVKSKSHAQGNNFAWYDPMYAAISGEENLSVLARCSRTFGIHRQIDHGIRHWATFLTLLLINVNIYVFHSLSVLSRFCHSDNIAKFIKIIIWFCHN